MYRIYGSIQFLSDITHHLIQLNKKLQHRDLRSVGFKRVTAFPRAESQLCLSDLSFWHLQKVLVDVQGFL